MKYILPILGVFIIVIGSIVTLTELDVTLEDVLLLPVVLFIANNWITVLIEFIAGFGYYLFNEFEDRSVRNKWRKNEQFFNTGISWRNKWALDEMLEPLPYVKKWYYFGVNPKYKERFFLSSTILVGFTDGEHLFQLLKNIFILLAIGIINIFYMPVFLLGRLAMSFIKERFIKWLA